MGTLRVSNIQNPSGTTAMTVNEDTGNITIPAGRTITNSGTSVGFGASADEIVTVKYNYDHPASTIRSSTNVSSIGDDAQGKISVNLTSNFANTNGSVSSAHNYYDPGSIAQTASVGAQELGIESTSELEGTTFYQNTLYDAGQNFGQAYGDLA